MRDRIFSPQPLSVESVDQPFIQPYPNQYNTTAGTQNERTIVHHPIRVVKEDAMIRVRKNMNVVILHARNIELIQECKGVLHVHIVIRDTVHH